MSELKPCEECRWYTDEVDIHCIFCRGEYIDRWEAKDEAVSDDDSGQV